MLENLCPKPDCRAVMTRHSEGEFDSWLCPASHGVAVTIDELWGHLQDDEMKAIWTAVDKGTPTSLLSPALGQPMVTVTVNADNDEEVGNTGPDAKSVTLDVSANERIVWFDLGELEVLPSDLPNAEPSAQELAKVKEIATTFVNSWAEAVKKRNNTGIFGLANHWADVVDPNGTISAGVSQIIPGKSPQEVAASWGPDDDVTVFPETPDTAAGETPKN